MIVCCAAPVLVATGVLAGIGAWLSSPWVIAAAFVLLAGAVTALAHHRRTGRAACCPPTDSTGDRADQAQEATAHHPRRRADQHP
jgi:hypothetical protein